jgi:hypothetical protein
MDCEVCIYGGEEQSRLGRKRQDISGGKGEKKGTYRFLPLESRILE